MTTRKVTSDRVRFCPSCRGAAVDASLLAGGDASCRACNWKGKQEALLVHDIKHEFSSSEEAQRFFAKDIQLVVASAAAQPIGRLLLKWGFVTQNSLDARVLGRYMRAIAQGIAAGIISEREKIELESAAIEQAQKGPANDAS